MRKILLVLLCSAGLFAVGCGGSDSDSTATDTTPPATTAAATTSADTTSTPSSTDTTPSGGDDTAEGRTIFTSNCGACHTLKDAATTGAVGPNLDEGARTVDVISNKVKVGGGPMPAFGNDGLLTDDQIADVSEYVVSVAGK